MSDPHDPAFWRAAASKWREAAWRAQADADMAVANAEYYSGLAEQAERMAADRQTKVKA